MNKILNLIHRLRWELSASYRAEVSRRAALRVLGVYPR